MRVRTGAKTVGFAPVRERFPKENAGQLKKGRSRNGVFAPPLSDDVSVYASTRILTDPKNSCCNRRLRCVVWLLAVASSSTARADGRQVALEVDPCVHADLALIRRILG